MKVLIVHQHYKTPQSGGAIRSYYLAKALVARGHEAVVITTHNKSGYKKTIDEGIEVHYLPIPYQNAFNFYQRSQAFVRFVMSTLSRAARVKPFNVCYAISVPLTTGLIAMRISSRYRVPYYFEVGDLWPDAPIEMGFLQNGILKWLLYRFEKSIYRSAKAVIALSPAIAKAIQAKVPSAKVHVIPNMADCEFYHPEEKRSDLLNKYQVQGKLVISYVGAMGLANGLDYIIECANLSRKAELPVHFIMAGEGALLERLKGNAAHLGLTNITFTGFVDRNGVKEIMNVTDAVFVSYKRLPVLETGSPNKFFDGLAAGKMIIVNFGGWIAEEVQKNSCGIRVDASDPTDFVRKIREFTAGHSRLKEIQQASRKLAEAKYDRKKLSDAWVAIVSSKF